MYNYSVMDKERLGLAFGVDEAIRRQKNFNLNFVYMYSGHYIIS